MSVTKSPTPRTFRTGTIERYVFGQYDSTGGKDSVEHDHQSELTYQYTIRPRYNITSSNDVLVFTASSGGGPVSVDVPDGTYSGDALATALQVAMNADDTLTDTGTVTFTVTWSNTTNKFTITADVGNITYTNVGSDGGAMFGFTTDQGPSGSIVSDTAIVIVVIGDSTFRFEGTLDGTNWANLDADEVDTTRTAAQVAAQGPTFIARYVGALKATRINIKALTGGLIAVDVILTIKGGV